MSDLQSKIESLLFLSGRPMSAREISELVKGECKEVEEAGDKLIAEYKDKNAGLQIIKNGASFQMVTSPENAALIQEFVKDETTGELSRPSLETLTIIAYRGPVAKTDLDRIRGVNCSLILRNLLIRGLVEARLDKKSGESYYVITFDFLQFLGLNEAKELPDYERLSKDDAIDRILADNPLAKSSFAAQSSASPEAVAGEEKSEDDKSVFVEISSVTEVVGGELPNASSIEDETEDEDNADDEDEDEEEDDDENEEEEESAIKV
jgi:segregation and condensation protein B